MSQPSTITDAEAGVPHDGHVQRSPVAVVEFKSLRELGAAFYLPAFLLHLLKAMAMLMLPLEALELGFSYDTIGVLSSLRALGAVVSNVPAGKLVTAAGSRTAATVAAALFLLVAACATAVTLLPSEDWTVMILALAFVAAGCGDATGVVARTTILGACVRLSIRGRAAALLGGILRAGFTLGPLIAGVVGEYAMSRSVYLLMAGLALLAILNSLLCIPAFDANQSIELKSKKNKEVNNEMAMSTLTVAHKHWRILCTSAFFCSFLILVRRARELFFALEGHRLGLSSSLIGSIWAVSFAVDGMLFPLAGWMLDRVGRVRTGALSMLGVGASLLILHGDSFAFYLAFAVVSGLFNSISAGLLQVLSADLAPAECRGQFISIFSTLSLCADIAGSALVGAVAEVTSLKTAGTIMAAAGAAGAVFGLSFMRETAKFSLKEKAEALQPHTKAAEIGKKDEDGPASAELGCAAGPTKQI